MIKRWRAILASAFLAVAAPAGAHPATELYIPIGKSPGVSNVRTRIGRIESAAATRSGMTVDAPGGPAYVAFARTTKFYVQYANAGRANQVGTYKDCQAGLLAEAYVADDGTVRWVKVLVP